MKIFKLHDKDGQSIYVNFDRVATMQGYVGYVGKEREEINLHTRIDFCGDYCIFVKETPREICRMVSKEEGSVCAGM